MSRFRCDFKTITFVVILAISFLIAPINANAYHDSLIGLATLRKMAKQAVPYSIAISDKKPTLIEFYANWCTSCQALAPTLDKLHQKYNQNVDFVMVNIDDTQSQDIIKKYQVVGIPHLVFLGNNQQVIKTLVGRVPEVVIDGVIASLKIN